MRSTCKYRLLGKATWGIAINLTAEYETVSNPLAPVDSISEGLWFICADRSLEEREVSFLRLGLQAVAASIIRARKQFGETLVRVLAVDYNPCDYQPEGLIAAMANWAAATFQFSPPLIDTTYDRARQRYVISLKAAVEPATEEIFRPEELRQDSSARLGTIHRLLSEGHTEAAAEQAAKVVRGVLRGMVPASATKISPDSPTPPVTMDDLLTVFAHSAKARPIPDRLKPHLVRVGSWSPDLWTHAQQPTPPEARALVTAAEEVVHWLSEEAA